MPCRLGHAVLLLIASASCAAAFHAVPAKIGVQTRGTFLRSLHASMRPETDGPSLASRRDALSTAAKVLLGVAGGAVLPLRQAHAASGADIWTAPLHNRYFLVRAGEQTWESEGSELISHPVYKLHMEKCGLSDAGYNHAYSAAETLSTLGFGATTEPWVWTSIHVAATQTAQAISSHHKISHHHVVPEFSFLDARGFGCYEGTPVAEARAAVWREDVKDQDYRMPPNEDGTPNESLRDVQVRVRQALQIMETQYQDLDIAIVAPDAETLSTLHCSLEGQPLVNAHSFHFSPGEVRLLDYRTRIETPNLAVSEDFGKLQLTGVQHNVMRVSNHLHINGPESFLNPQP